MVEYKIEDMGWTGVMPSSGGYKKTRRNILLRDIFGGGFTSKGGWGVGLYF